MTSPLESALSALTKGLENAPLPEALTNTFKTKLDERQNVFDELIIAKENGYLSQSEFENELERERKLLEAELLTEEIAVKAEVQRAVNTAFQAITDAVL